MLSIRWNNDYKNASYFVYCCVTFPNSYKFCTEKKTITSGFVILINEPQVSKTNLNKLNPADIILQLTRTNIQNNDVINTLKLD